MSTAPQERMFTYTTPSEFLGARFYEIIPDNPLSAKQKRTITIPLSEYLPDSIGFSKNCQKEYEIRPTILGPQWLGTEYCSHLNHEPHGHLILACEDGHAFIDAPIASKAFFQMVLDGIAQRDSPFSSGFREEEMKAAAIVLADDIKDLPDNLTEHEKKLLETKTIDELVGKIVWVS